MRKIAIILFLLLAALLSACGFGQDKQPAYAPKRQAAEVIRTIDGDTLLVKMNGKQERVRMLGMDTPETKKEGTPVQHFGPEASAYTKSQLAGKTVYLEFDAGERDKFGRLLAYVWRDQKETDPRKMFNSELVLKGYARIVTIPPNVKHADDFKKYQTEARAKRQGLWK